MAWVSQVASTGRNEHTTRNGRIFPLVVHSMHIYERCARSGRNR